MVEHFIKKYNCLTEKNIDSINEKVMNLFLSYPWPGNVRQMENIMEHAFVLAKANTIELQHLPPEFHRYASDHIESEASNLSSLCSLNERHHILTSLNKNRWNKAKTARELGISRTTLWRKMKEMQIPMYLHENGAPLTGFTD